MRPKGYRKTKLKELFGRSKRTTIALISKWEFTTVTGYTINRNGKTIL